LADNSPRSLIGRITKGVGGNYWVLASCGTSGVTLGKEFVCQARGLFRKQEITPLVGDFVEFSVVDEAQATGFLQKILPRANTLIRPKVANVDQVVVVCAVRPAINMHMLDAFLISCEKQDVNAILCINKIELEPDSAGQSYKEVLKMYEMAGYIALGVSAKAGLGLDALRELLAGKVSIFAGASGVGKSSILNALYPNLALETGGLSEKIGRGKHTTRHTSLVQVGSDSFVVDSPGFTSLNIDHIPKNEIQDYYPEFDDYKYECYYVGCNHITEHDCAVKEQVGLTIHPVRYEQYRVFMK